MQRNEKWMVHVNNKNGGTRKNKQNKQNGLDKQGNEIQAGIKYGTEKNERKNRTQTKEKHKQNGQN
jgi:hypothetical protein